MSNTIVTVVTNAGAALLSQVIADKGTISWISATSTSATPPEYTPGDHEHTPSPDNLDLTVLKSWDSSNFSTKTSTGTVTAVNYKKDTVNNIDYLEVTCVLSSDTNVVPKLIGAGNVFGIYAKEDGTDDSTAILFAVAARSDRSKIHEFADGIDTVYFTFDVALRNTPAEDLAVDAPNNTGFYALASDLTTFKDSLWKRGAGTNPDTGVWPSFKSEMTEWADGLYKDNSPDPATGTLATFKSSLETWRDELWTKPNPSAGIVESGEWPTFKNELYTWKDALYKDNSPDPPTGLWPAFKAKIEESSGVRVETIQTITGAKTFTPTSVAGVTDSSEQGDAAVNGISFVKDDNGAGVNTVLMPTSNNTCYIGTTDNRFNSMYTYSLYCTDNITCGSVAASGNITVTGSIYVSGLINGTVTNASYATSATSANKWASSRTFTIKDNDSTNSGPSASVDGSSNVTLKLPSTIKASLSGTASNAMSDSLGNNIRSSYGSKLALLKRASYSDTTTTEGITSSSDASSNYLTYLALKAPNGAIISRVGIAGLVASALAGRGSASNDNSYVTYDTYGWGTGIGSLGLFVASFSSSSSAQSLSPGSLIQGSKLKPLDLRGTSSTSFISSMGSNNHGTMSYTWRVLNYVYVPINTACYCVVLAVLWCR